MGRHHVSSSNGADSSVGGEHDDGSKCGLQGSVQEGKAFDVKHVHLIHEEHSGNKLCNSLVNVAVHYFVYFSSQFLCDFSLLWLHYLPHKTHEIVASLRTSIGHIEVMKGDILNNFFFLVHVSLRKRHILFSLKIKLASVCIASSNSLHVPSGGLDVDDITNGALFPCEILVDGRVQFELLCAFGSLEGNDDAGNYLIA